VTDEGVARLVTKTKRSPVDTADVAQLHITFDDHIASTQLDQGLETQTAQTRCHDPYHLTVAKHAGVTS